MSVLTHLLHFSATEEDQGVFLVWRCPRCEALRDYHLIVAKGNLSLVGLPLGKPQTMLDLRCCQCLYEIKVPLSEKEFLDRARQATTLVKSGSLTPELYLAAIREMPARFVSDLLALTQTWNCQKCGEANPMSFDSCWNCASKESPVTNHLESTGQPFPGFPRGGNSWE